MAAGINYATAHETPYLTVAEYKDAPTAIDINNLVVGGNAGAQDAELLQVITRASSFMNEYLNQDLTAGSNVETQRVRMTPQGYLAIHPDNWPIVALTDLQFGTDPNSLTTLPDCSKVWFENQQMIVPLSQLSTNVSSEGPLGFGFPVSGRSFIFVKYTYAAGYVNTTIAANVSIGATSLTVAKVDGIIPGDTLTIADGALTETVRVSNSYVYGSTTILLTAGLTYAHTTGVSIGNLPRAVKEACILATTAFIKVRGDRSLTMSITTAASGNTAGSNLYGSEIALALQMIDAYRRIR